METVVSSDRWLTLAASAGKISAFRFGYTPNPEVYVWPRRTIREHLLYFCTHGGFTIVLRNETVTVNRGCFVWIMPGVEHETRLLPNRRPFRTYYLRLDVKEEDNSSARLSQDIFWRNDACNLMPLLRDLVLELQSPHAFHEQRLRATLMLLSAAVIGPGEVPRRAVFSTQQRERLRRYMEHHATQRVAPKDLADELSLSPRYFRSIFHRSFGMSPMHWIVRQRILVAALMLAGTELRAKEVAYQLGYCDRYLFSRQFKQIMGVSPQIFRRGGGSAPAWEQVDVEISAVSVARTAIDSAVNRIRKARAASAD